MRKSVCFLFLLSLMVISLIKNTDANNEENELGIEKKLDKMRYYGGLGKRADNSDEESDDDSSDEIRYLRKRLDKLRYYGSLGKRNYYKNYNLDEIDSGKLRKTYLNLKRNHKQNGIDKLRFMGNLGKK